jgi:uncharacterized lipoprotein YajG
MRHMILIFAATLGLAACGDGGKTVVVTPPQPQSSTVVVPQGATVICPNGNSATYANGAYRC